MNTDQLTAIRNIIQQFNSSVVDTNFSIDVNDANIVKEFSEIGISLTPSRLKAITELFDTHGKPKVVKSLSVSIPIKPRGAGRPRATSRGGAGVRLYAAPKDTAFKKEFIALLRKELDTELNFMSGMINVDLTFYMPFPSKFNMNEKALAALGILRPTVKPDFDNLAKLPVDAMNEILFNDDVQIVEGLSTKFYSAFPRIELFFEYTDSVFTK